MGRTLAKRRPTGRRPGPPPPPKARRVGDYKKAARPNTIPRLTVSAPSSKTILIAALAMALYYILIF